MQSPFPRLQESKECKDNGERRSILHSLVLLHNFNTSTVQIFIEPTFFACQFISGVTTMTELLHGDSEGWRVESYWLQVGMAMDQSETRMDSWMLAWMKESVWVVGAGNKLIIPVVWILSRSMHFDTLCAKMPIPGITHCHEKCCVIISENIRPT